MKNKSFFQPYVISLNRIVLSFIFFNFFVLSSIYYILALPKYPYFNYSIQNHIHVLILASLAIAIFSFGRYLAVGYFTGYRPAKNTFGNLIPPGLSRNLLLSVFAIGILLFILMIIAGGGWSRILQYEGAKSQLLVPSKTGISFGYFFCLAEAFLFAGGGLLGAAFLQKRSRLFSFNVLTVSLIPFLLWSLVFMRFTALSVPLYVFLFWFQVCRRFPIRKYILSILILTLVAVCYIFVIGSTRGDVTKVKDSRIIVNSFENFTEETFMYLSQGQEVSIIADKIARGKLAYSYGSATLTSFLGPFGCRINLPFEQADSIFTKVVYDRVTGIDTSLFVCWVSLLGQGLIEGGIIGVIILFFFFGAFVGLYDQFIIRKVHVAAYLHPFMQLAIIDVLFQGARPAFKYCLIGIILSICTVMTKNQSRKSFNLVPHQK